MYTDLFMNMGKSKNLVLFDIDYTLFRTDHFKLTDLAEYSLYDEVSGVLREIDKVSTLGIFSEGDVAFQKEKLIKTNIEKFFLNSDVHIVDKKDETLKEIINKYKNKKIFIVDDKLQVLHALKMYDSNLFTIWIKRGYYANKQKPINHFDPDATVSDLLQAGRIIKDNLL